MKRSLTLVLTFTLLLTACGKNISDNHEEPSVSDMQVVPSETDAPTKAFAPNQSDFTETPEPESESPIEMPTFDSGTLTEAPTSEPSALTTAGTPAVSDPALSSISETIESTDSPAQETPVPVETPGPTESMEEQDVAAMAVSITINGKSFRATLYDNGTAAALKEKLPVTLDMSELNGNGKYNYLPFSLPTDAGNPGQIHTGDLMLYGSDCLVLFYESFSTGYRYTPIGRVDDPAGLADAVGSGGVRVTFALE